MSTNLYPGVGYLTHGFDNNFYQLFSITATTFGGGSVSGQQPDIIIPLKTQAVILTNLSTSGTVEVSYNGNTVHNIVTGSSTVGINQQLIFNPRVISMIWFRLQSGTAGPCSISVAAWAQQ